jgi:hypothetical protein
MGKRDDRRRQQEREHLAQIAMSNARPNEPPPPRSATEDVCPVNGAHDYTMKGPDGIRRCWYCVKQKPKAVPA